MPSNNTVNELAALLRPTDNGSASSGDLRAGGVAGSSATALSSVLQVLQGTNGTAKNADATIANAPSTGLAQELSDLSRQIADMKAAAVRQAESIEQNTKSVAENTASKIKDVAASAVSSVASGQGLLSFGLGLIPLIGGIAKLFGGGKSEEPAPLPKFSLPPALSLESAMPTDNGTGLSDISYGSDGLARRTVQSQTAPAPQITVQVQALDSQSFLDRSDDIARAVKEAMLNMHSITDVMGDL